MALVGATLTAGCGGGGGGAAPTTSNGGVRRLDIQLGRPPLKATLTLPARTDKAPAIVLMSGSGPNDQDETVGPNKPFRDLADGLAERGIATLRYDKRTRDHPPADLSSFTATDEYVPDGMVAVTLLQDRPEIDPAKVFVLGHSQGGTFAPKVAELDPSVAGVILMAAAAAPFGETLLRQLRFLASLPNRGGLPKDLDLDDMAELARKIDDPNLSPKAELNSPLLGGASATYFRDLSRYDAVATAKALPQPILVLQGQRDYQVTEADDLARWTAGLDGRSDVVVKRYPDANHLFIDGGGPPGPSEYGRPGHVSDAVLDDIAAWVTSLPA